MMKKKNSNSSNSSNSHIDGRSSRGKTSRLTLLLLLASLFPVGVLAWSTPGESFTGELTLGGPVTNTRNPWVWKVMPGETSVNLSGTDGRFRQDSVEWSGLLQSQPILLGKTVLNTPSGRDGLAPKVTYGSDESGTSPVWLGEGLAQVTLPVYDATGPAVTTGQLSFRLQVAMILRHNQKGLFIYSGVHSDLDDNGLPPQGKSMTPGGSIALLCRLFAGEGPDWLCATSTSVTGELALSRLTDNTIRRPQGAYGAGVVGGSGVLNMHKKDLPAHWKTTLSVSIEYQ